MFCVVEGDGGGFMKRFLIAVITLGEAVLSPLPAATEADIEKDWMRQDSGRVDVSACFADSATNALEAGEAAAEIVGNCFGTESDLALWAWYLSALRPAAYPRQGVLLRLVPEPGSRHAISPILPAGWT